MIPNDLPRFHLFEPLNEDQLRRVRETAKKISLKPREMLFSQGDPAGRFFMVRTGSLQLFLLSREGEEKVIDVLRPGQFFAEAVMFMENPAYPVNASALSESEVLAFDNLVFLGLLRESHDLAIRLLGEMTRRLHGLVRQIDELSLHNATYRLVAYLLRQQKSPDGHVVLSVPKQTIASRLSIQPETLSRILGRLREKELVEVTGENITLLDESRLRGLLEP